MPNILSLLTQGGEGQVEVEVKITNYFLVNSNTLHSTQKPYTQNTRVTGSSHWF